MKKKNSIIIKKHEKKEIIKYDEYCIKIYKNRNNNYYTNTVAKKS